MQKGLAGPRVIGLQNGRSFYVTLLAKAYVDTGRLNDGLGPLTEALAAADKNEIRQYEAELQRLKGQLLLKQDGTNTAEVQTCFQRAIEIARNQSAKSFELRTTTSLARLLNEQGKRDEARTMLAQIYRWFTEGFDTADLKDAKAPLDKLSQ
jgi:predicted ATPase